MSTITVQFAHQYTRCPIAEFTGVNPMATLAELRVMLQHRFAEESCMMRVFTRWHAVVAIKGKKREIELTAQDESASLTSLGIEDCSLILLEGPITESMNGVALAETMDGVAQAVGIMGEQMLQQRTQVDSLLKGIEVRMTAMMEQMSGISQLIGLPNSEHATRLSLTTEEHQAFDSILLQQQEFKARYGLLAASGLEFQHLTTKDKSGDLKDQEFKRVVTKPTPAPTGSWTAMAVAPDKPKDAKAPVAAAKTIAVAETAVASSTVPNVGIHFTLKITDAIRAARDKGRDPKEQNFKIKELVSGEVNTVFPKYGLPKETMTRIHTVTKDTKVLVFMDFNVADAHEVLAAAQPNILGQRIKPTLQKSENRKL